MGYFRVTYEGYLEGEYETADDAIEEFAELAKEDIETHFHITVEEYDEESGKWM